MNTFQYGEVTLPDITLIDSWGPDIYYSENAVVVFSSLIYRCALANKGVIPYLGEFRIGMDLPRYTTKSNTGQWQLV